MVYEDMHTSLSLTYRFSVTFYEYIKVLQTTFGWREASIIFRKNLNQVGFAVVEVLHRNESLNYTITL
jgi:hypothetical protein